MAEAKPRPMCGIVMPISTIEDCSEAHWADVRVILEQAIEGAGLDSQLVSEADDVGVIHKRIVQNLYDNPIVVCDVSAKNPNVMFELGLRLAFDKPTIIVKDDQTPYSFDTGAIEHLEYPRDLRYSKIVQFQQRLSDKIKYTLDISQSPDYSTFLKNFGEFKVAKIDKKEVSTQEFIIEELKSMRSEIRRISPPKTGSTPARNRQEAKIGVYDISDEVYENSIMAIFRCGGVKHTRKERDEQGHLHLFVGIQDSSFNLSKVTEAWNRELSDRGLSGSEISN